MLSQSFIWAIPLSTKYQLPARGIELHQWLSHLVLMGGGRIPWTKEAVDWRRGKGAYSYRRMNGQPLSHAIWVSYDWVQSPHVYSINVFNNLQFTPDMYPGHNFQFGLKIPHPSFLLHIVVIPSGIYLLPPVNNWLRATPPPLIYSQYWITNGHWITWTH